MKSGILILLLVTFLSLAGTPLRAQPSAHGHGDEEAAKNGWLFNLEEGITQAEKNGKPLMVVFRCLP
jgi:hypothetical protein